MIRSHAIALVLALGSACAHAPASPREVADAYAAALAEGRLEDARKLTAGAEPPEAFRERYREPGAREARAAEVRGGLPRLEARAPGVRLVQTGDGWRVADVAPEEAPRAALEQFLRAAEARDWPAAYALLAGPLRARYTPRLLGEDFAREPLARERLARLRAALASPLVLSATEARLPLGGERAARLVLEDGAWRLAALE